MNELVQELKNLLNHNSWLQAYNDDKYVDEFNNFAFEKLCTQEEIKKFLEYNFGDLFNVFGAALKFEFSHKDEPNIFTFSLNSNMNLLSEYIEEIFIAHNYVNLIIYIDKIQLINNLLSETILEDLNIKIFFSAAKFLDKINKFSFRQIEEAIFIKNKRNVIIILDDHVMLYNELLFILGGMSNKQISDQIKLYHIKNFETDKYRRIVQWHNEVCHWINGIEWLCPNYLYFDCRNEDFIFSKEIWDYFSKKTIELVVPFIADYTIADENNGHLICTINGHKKIDIHIKGDLIYNDKMIRFLYRQYDWVYKEYSTDKLSILRNLITTLLCEDCNCSYVQLLLNKSNEIYNSVQKNFDIYLQKNVKEYFQERHNVREMISNKSKDITNQVNSLIENMNKNFLTSIGVTIAAGLGYIAKPNILILKISALMYAMLIFTNAVLTIPFYWFRIKDIIDDYKEHIESFDKILVTSDIPKDAVDKSKNRFYLYWIISIIFYLIIIICAVIAVIKTRELIDLAKKIF
jgi:hypothetical protein